MPIDATQIVSLGWRQGSIFSVDASRKLLAANLARIETPEFIVSDNSRLILSSHDCDISHPGPHEPRIEVCPAIVLTGPIDGQFAGTRNARRLHINLLIDNACQAFELRAPTRFSLPRETLQEFAPDAAAKIVARHEEHFVHWLSKRIRRSALPTEFDRRINKGIRKRIKSILKPSGDAIYSLLVAIDPDDEDLPDGNDYNLQVVALMYAEDFAQAPIRKVVDSTVEQLQRLLDNCSGIALDACATGSTETMTVEEYRGFLTWDLDDVSFEAGDLPSTSFP